MQNWIYENKRYKDWFRANGRPEPLGVSISWKIYKEILRENVRKSRIFHSIFRITETISKYLSFCLKELSLCHKLWFSNPATSLQSDTVKELSFCHKLWFSYPYIFAFQCRRPKIFQTMNYFRSNNDSLKYYRLKPSCCKEIAIWKSEFLAKPQFLSTSALFQGLFDLETAIKMRQVHKRFITLSLTLLFRHDVL